MLRQNPVRLTRDHSGSARHVREAESGQGDRRRLTAGHVLSQLYSRWVSESEQVTREPVIPFGGHAGLPPAGPDPGERGPEEAISSAQARSRHCSLVDGELLAQGQVREGELAMAADDEEEEPELGVRG